jgi:Tol biopolymer transport system component
MRSPKGSGRAVATGRSARRVRAASVVLVATALALEPVGATPPTTTRVSVSSSGAQANNASVDAAVSANGRYVAFQSWASNLVAGDNNGGVADVFVHDRVAQTTTLVSVSSAGEQANDESLAPTISGDGRYVAFASAATNLTPEGAGGLFLHDTATGTTSRLGLGNTPSISADGRHVAFWWWSDLLPGGTPGVVDVYVRDLVTGITTRVSVSSSGVPGDGESSFPVGTHISADGRYVAFESQATNLVAGDTNTCGGSFTVPGRCPDVFVHDRDADVDGVFDEPGEISTTRASVSSSGEQSFDGLSIAPSMSADGRYVAFESTASNLVPGDTAQCGGPPGNVQSCTDVFVRDLVAQTTIRASFSPVGGQGIGQSATAWISGDGRFVAFATTAPNLAPCDSNGLADIVLYDRLTATITLVSVAGSSGQQANGHSGLPAVSADGSVVAFESVANNLDPIDPAGLLTWDTNGTLDIYVRDGATQPHPLGPVSGPIYRTDAGNATPLLRTADCNLIWPQGL